MTESAADFETLAVKLAKDPEALERLRDKLVKARESSSLFNTAAFTRNLETAYRTMWRAWLAGEQAKGFTVGT